MSSRLMGVHYGSLNCALQGAIIISQLVQSTRDFGLNKMLDKNYILPRYCFTGRESGPGECRGVLWTFSFGMLGSLGEVQHLYVNCDVRQLSSVASRR